MIDLTTTQNWRNTTDKTNRVFDTNNKQGEEKTMIEDFGKTWSNMVAGKTVSEINNADQYVSKIKSLGERASRKDPMAITQLNELRRIAVEPLIMERLKLLSIFGDYKNLGFDESVEVDVYSQEGELARMQASNGTPVFPIMTKHRYTITPETITGGYAVDYRRIGAGDMYMENIGRAEVVTDIFNRANAYVMLKTFYQLKSAKGVKYLHESAGITQAGLDKLLNDVRRLGKTDLVGDMNMISQINVFASIANTATGVAGVSQEALDEIRREGFISSYNGALTYLIENPYNFTQLNSTGDNFQTLLPQGLLLAIPKNRQRGSAIRTFTRGGLTMFDGQDVNTGQVLTRYDLEVASDLIKGREFEIGVYRDVNYDFPADYK